MSKIFNNTDKTVHKSEAELALSGWDEKTKMYDDNRIAHITDTVGAGIALSKLGTSIPTPFARIFLFETAFAQVNALGPDTDSVYGKLVSECLDFLEFLFNYGDDVEIKAWNVDENIQNLKDSEFEGHQRLGFSLEKFARDLNVNNIYLFYYDGVLIGGTSPFTLVYTSPNWQRNKTIANAQGIDQNVLFQNYADPNVSPVPLHKRNIKFREFLTDYIIAFRRVNRFASSQLREYIYNNQANGHDPQMKTYYAQNTGANPIEVDIMREKYSTFSTGADIDILGLGGLDSLLLGYGKSIPGPGPNPNPLPDDYKIKATKTRYLHNFDGVEILPLVLSDYGITGAKYIGGRPWQEGTMVPKDSSQALSTRVLPGGGKIVYPYLTDADFLEDKILKMSYDINNKAFETFGISGNYLPPLKSALFEYFDIDDINSIPGLSFSLTEVGNGVEAKLSIPVKYQAQPYIVLKKVYTQEDIITVKNMPGFSIAIFPSYKIVNSPVPNTYSILSHDSSIHPNLQTSFYSIGQNEIVKLEVKDDNIVERTKNASKYIKVDTSFDFISVEWDGVRAMLIPKLKIVTPNVNGGATTTVGVDFGTTNSYVSLSYNSGANPETLQIKKDDLQVLLLNDADLSEGNYGKKYMDSMSMMPSFIQSLDREYAPLLLGKQSDVEFPYRTVTCESPKFKDPGQKHIFGHINVGFNFMKEIIVSQDFSYNTDIKWGIENPNPKGLTERQNRVKAFCTQIAWMIKNKIMLGQNPSAQFTVYLTFPFTMARPVKTEIENYWQEAFDEMMGDGNVTLKRTTESIAPYYYMIANGATFTENAMNIDVGGGTTDMLFADVENKKFYYNSSLFAGNDIWGDGKQLVEAIRMDNGFVKYFEDLLNGNNLSVNEERKNAYFKYKSLVSSSADLMSYIFRYDDEFNFISYIKKSKEKLMPILYLHLGALIYHVAQVLKEKKMTVPTTITFSGMGAKYIHLISTNEDDINELIKALLSEFMGYGYEDDDDKMPEDFKVTFQKNPKEVTAQGAMLEDNPALNSIKGYKQKEIYVYGVEDAPKHLSYGETSEYKDKCLTMFEQFINDFLENRDLKHYLSKQFQIQFSDAFIKAVKGEAKMSFDLMSQSKKASEDVEETLFFWPLKNGLYKASQL